MASEAAGVSATTKTTWGSSSGIPYDFRSSVQDGVVDAAAYALSYVQQTAFWIYLFLASIPVMVLYDVFFVGLFVFEYEKNDIVLSSDSRILVDKANADAGVFDEDDKVAS